MTSVVDPTEENDLRARLSAATPEERQEVLRETVLTRVSELLQRPEMDEDSNFLENGLTSLSALELAKSLMNATGLEVPLVAVVENPTAEMLGKYIAEVYEADL